MQLQRLTGLERQKILDELAELVKTIERLRAILSSDELIIGIVVDELKAIRDKYGDDRRTDIIEDSRRVPRRGPDRRRGRRHHGDRAPATSSAPRSTSTASSAAAARA